MIRSLARGLEVLTLLAEAPDGLGVSEIALALSVDKSTAMRLMKTLVDGGFAQQGVASRRYYMTMKLVGLGHRYLDDMRLRESARPLLTQLVAETRESAHLAVIASGQALVLEDIATSETLRVQSGAGRFAPLHCTAIGKALLAFTDEPPPSDLTPYTANTITDPAALQTHLQHIREQGFALDDEEYTPGVRCLAAPLYGPHGLCVAVTGISGPTVRLSYPVIKVYSQLVLETAHTLSQALGT